ncbi:MAG TPA: TonB-dependent receptor [Terracidiphilus sp.]|nr:TonB-dependent receptor [Terracidiphilus sp.]
MNTTPTSTGSPELRSLLNRLFPMAAMLSLVLGLASLPAFGQAFGTIGGTVTDQSGAMVPGAKVTITETGTGFSRGAVTDSGGYYVVPNLRPTQYNVTVVANGFEKFEAQNVSLLANQAATVDVNLRVGSEVQTLVINANSAPLVNTTNQTLSDVIESARMEDLPLNGRVAAQSLNLIAGAGDTSVSSSASQSSPPGAVHVNINGSRDNQTNYSLDGAFFVDQYYNVNVPFPFPDALQEFSVQTENYSARFGGSAGGVVNVVTRGGTNSVHGDLFEYVKNQVFNAYNYFNHTLDTMKRNQYGGTIGGPVWIPHIYNGRDRTFFFFGYQGERYRNGGTGSGNVPTYEELHNGDFSALLSATNPNNPFGKVEQLVNPWTGKSFPGNQIPTSMFDPAALTIATKWLPQATPNTAGQVLYPTSSNQNIDSYIIRIDQRLGNKDNLFGRFYRDHIVVPPVMMPNNLLDYNPGFDQPFKNLMVQETHTFRPTLLNQLSFTFSDVPTEKTFVSNSPNVRDFGVTIPWLPSDKWLQAINVSGAFNISGGAKGPFNTSNIGFQDNISWVHGRHNMDIGADFSRASVDLGDQFQSQGTFGFNSTIVNNMLAAFLIGYEKSFSQGYGEYKNNRNFFQFYYFNDSFHASSRLTLNLGIRYEPYSPWNEIKGRGEQFNIDRYNAGIHSQLYPNAPAGLLFPGDPGMPWKCVNAVYTDVSPRIGAAYDVFGNGKSSIRGGVGLFYDTMTPGVVNNRFADIAPFSPQVSLTPPPGPFSQPLKGFTGYYPFPFTYPPSSSTQFTLPTPVTTWDQNGNYQVPQVYAYDLAVEQQISANWMLQVAYVGSQSRHQKETIELDPAVYVAGSKLSDDRRRMFAPNYGSISMDGQDVGGNFNALELTLKRRMSERLSLTVAYTYSKSLDDIPNGGGDNDIGADSSSTLPWTDPNRHAFDYGPSGFDHTHRLVGSYVYHLPDFKNTNVLVRNVIGGWETSGILTFQTAGVFTVGATGSDISGTGLNQERAVQLPGVNPFLSGSCGQNRSTYCSTFLNPAAFTAPAPGTFGNVHKNSFRGFNSFNADAGLFKNFSAEFVKFQFRAEFFNVLNHVNFGNPTSNYYAANFGDVTGGSGPRVGQLALKMTF